jgi:Excreted virulence factor EspC, type VII ESX diderm
MPTFQVQTEALTAAAALVMSANGDFGKSQTALSGSSGALAGTPVMFAFDEFLGSAQTALTSMNSAVDGLSRALNEAATAYAIADETAATSLRRK